MSISVIDHGVWERYVPDTLPDAAPANAMFARRLSDGKDWYLHGRDPDSWQEGSLRATALVTDVGEIAQAVVRDESLLFPAGCRLFEILGHDPSDTTPWKAYERRILDINAGTFSAIPDTIGPVRHVSAAQAKTALYNAGLLDYALAAVKEHGYPPVQIYWDSATYWEIDNPYVQAIAEELSLNPTQLQMLFDAANKL